MAGTSEHSFKELLKGETSPAYMLVCEHASNQIPDEYGNLGLSDELLHSHIAWDPGAASVTARLSELLHAPAILGGASRLLYDCNRPVDAHDAIPARSEVFEVPGNQNLSMEQKRERVERFYRPFHAALSTALDRQSNTPALVTIHSFTPVYRGKRRNVEIGILHDEDCRLADAMLESAHKLTPMLVLKNEPYGPDDGVMHTLKLHGIERGLLNVMLEVRNDLLQTEAQCFAIADLLANMLNEAMNICSHSTIARRASS